MIRLVSFLLLIVAVLGECPSGSIYDSNFNRCYKYGTDASAFFLAEQKCVGLGGHLASIQNGFENALISETAANQFKGAASFWIGANELMFANWSWTDNTPFTFTNWGSSQPDETNQCAVLVQNNTKWASASCGVAKPYVCVIPGETTSAPVTCPTPAPHVGYCASEWTYFDGTDQCYIVRQSASFDTAENTCKAMNAHLASIHSKAENDFVAGLASTGMSCDWNQLAWIGMTKVNGVWTNVDGTKVDYYNWGPKEPDNSKGDEFCVQIIPDEVSGKGHENYRLTWNDEKCSETMRAFVCKRAALH